MRQPFRSIPSGVVAGFSALILAGGGVTAWWTLNTNQPNPSPTPVSQLSPTPPDSLSGGEQVEVYWLQSNNSAVELTPSTIALEQSGSPDTVLEEALKRLLAGPTDPAVMTTIPAGTKLKALALKPDGIHIDLSKEFTSGGGSASMQGRVAQILYTTSSLDPAARVWLSVEGRPLEALGGEGLLLDQPITRQDFEQNFTP